MNNPLSWEERFDEEFLNKDTTSSRAQFNEKVQGRLPTAFKAFIKQTVREAVDEVSVARDEMVLTEYSLEGIKIIDGDFVKGFNAAVDALEEAKEEVMKRYE